MAVDAHQDAPWPADIATAATDDENSTPTVSSVQLGKCHHNPEKAQPEAINPQDANANGHDPEKLGTATEQNNATAAAAAGSAPPSLPPDGGLQAWLVVVGAFCSLFVSFGWINCMCLITQITVYHDNRNDVDEETGIGVFQDYYQAHQLKDMSPSAVTWIPSLETFVMFFGVRIYIYTSIPRITIITPTCLLTDIIWLSGYRALSSAPSSTTSAPAGSSSPAPSSTSSA